MFQPFKARKELKEQAVGKVLHLDQSGEISRPD